MKAALPLIWLIPTPSYGDSPTIHNTSETPLSSSLTVVVDPKKLPQSPMYLTGAITATNALTISGKLSQGIANFWLRFLAKAPPHLRQAILGVVTAGATVTHAARRVLPAAQNNLSKKDYASPHVQLIQSEHFRFGSKDPQRVPLGTHSPDPEPSRPYWPVLPDIHDDQWLHQQEKKERAEGIRQIKKRILNFSDSHHLLTTDQGRDLIMVPITITDDALRSRLAELTTASGKKLIAPGKIALWNRSYMLEFTATKIRSSIEMYIWLATLAGQYSEWQIGEIYGKSPEEVARLATQIYTQLIHYIKPARQLRLRLTQHSPQKIYQSLAGMDKQDMRRILETKIHEVGELNYTEEQWNFITPRYLAKFYADEDLSSADKRILLSIFFQVASEVPSQDRPYISFLQKLRNFLSENHVFLPAYLGMYREHRDATHRHTLQQLHLRLEGLSPTDLSALAAQMGSHQGTLTKDHIHDFIATLKAYPMAEIAFLSQVLGLDGLHKTSFAVRHNLPLLHVSVLIKDLKKVFGNYVREVRGTQTPSVGQAVMSNSRGVRPVQLNRENVTDILNSLPIPTIMEHLASSRTINKLIARPQIITPEAYEVFASSVLTDPDSRLIFMGQILTYPTKMPRSKLSEHLLITPHEVRIKELWIQMQFMAIIFSGSPHPELSRPLSRNEVSHFTEYYLSRIHYEAASDNERTSMVMHKAHELGLSVPKNSSETLEKLSLLEQKILTEDYQWDAYLHIFHGQNVKLRASDIARVWQVSLDEVLDSIKMTRAEYKSLLENGGDNDFESGGLSLQELVSWFEDLKIDQVESRLRDWYQSHSQRFVWNRKAMGNLMIFTDRELTTELHWDMFLGQILGYFPDSDQEISDARQVSITHVIQTRHSLEQKLESFLHSFQPTLPEDSDVDRLSLQISKATSESEFFANYRHYLKWDVDPQLLSSYHQLSMSDLLARIRSQKWFTQMFPYPPNLKAAHILIFESEFLTNTLDQTVFLVRMLGFDSISGHELSQQLGVKNHRIFHADVRLRMLLAYLLLYESPGDLDDHPSFYPRVSRRLEYYCQRINHQHPAALRRKLEKFAHSKSEIEVSDAMMKAVRTLEAELLQVDVHWAIYLQRFLDPRPKISPKKLASLWNVTESYVEEIRLELDHRFAQIFDPHQALSYKGHMPPMMELDKNYRRSIDVWHSYDNEVKKHYESWSARELIRIIKSRGWFQTLNLGPVTITPETYLTFEREILTTPLLQQTFLARHLALPKPLYIRQIAVIHNISLSEAYKFEKLLTLYFLHTLASPLADLPVTTRATHTQILSLIDYYQNRLRHTHLSRDNTGAMLNTVAGKRFGLQVKVSDALIHEVRAFEQAHLSKPWHQHLYLSLILNPKPTLSEETLASTWKIKPAQIKELHLHLTSQLKEILSRHQFPEKGNERMR